MVLLSLDHFFAAGGNRCCFEHPDDLALCVKVNRKDRSPEVKKANAVFYKRIRPLSAFDENLEEKGVMDLLKKQFPEAVDRLIPRCYGWVETPYGRGLVLSMYRNMDGDISSSLEAELFKGGMTGELQAAIDAFVNEWRCAKIPSRQLLLHNIVVVRSLEGCRLVVIDGLGYGEVFRISQFFPALEERRVEKKLQTFLERVNDFCKRCESQDENTQKWASHRADPMSVTFKKKCLGIEGE